MKSLISRFALIAALFATAAPAVAEVYPASNWLPPANFVSIYGYEDLAKAVKAETNGAISFEVYHSGSLLPAKTTLQGVADGIAAVGPVFPGYTPAEVPLNFLMNDTSFVTSDDFATALAYSELGLTNGRIRDEWIKKGAVFGGAYSTAVYGMACMKTVDSLEGLKGMKLRSAGGAQAAWTQSVGAVPVAATSAEILSGLERGSIDCALTDPTNVDQGNKFGEIIKSFTTLPLGVAIGANWAYDLDFWRKITPAQRRSLLNNMGRAIVDIQVAYVNGVANSMKYMADKGISVHEPKPELVAYMTDYQAKYLDGVIKVAKDDRKIENPEELIQAFRDLIEKWTGLLNSVDRTDKEALYKLVQDNLYGKIDENTFAMQ